ncbi:MAG: hypothetical protein JWP70_358, partial [Leifsonia sp.]|nr:hypothetical protein [Leifsonia sp.]
MPKVYCGALTALDRCDLAAVDWGRES